MNKKEFTQIYQKHYPVLYKYLYNVGKCKELANDLCQETFLKLYNEFQKGAKIEFLKSWLFKCAYNAFLNHVKRNKIISFDNSDSQNDLVDNSNPEDSYIKSEKHKNVEFAINKLPQKERELIYLYQEDFSYAEIAEISGIKVTSVGKTLARTIEKISKQLQKTKCYEVY